jgi:hypothetical protein
MYLNHFQLLLKLLVLDDKDFILFLTILHLRLPIFIQVLVGNLKKDDKTQDIRTHKYHATCMRHTATILKCTQKFQTVKEEKLNLQHFRSNVLLIPDTATALTVINLGSIHERVKYLPLLHTMTDFWAT